MMICGAKVRAGALVAWACVVGWARAAYERVRVAFAVALAAYRVTVLQSFLQTSEFVAYKVVAFNDDTGEHRKVTTTFAPQAWEAAVRDHTAWTTDKLRVDVRYYSRGKKFRMTLRPGDTCSFAALHEPRCPDGVLSAELLPTGEPSALPVNVTARVLKYQGLGKDFQAGMGHRVSLFDMFPMDDPDDLQANYSGLRVVHLADKSVRTRLVPMDCEDVRAALLAEV